MGDLENAPPADSKPEESALELILKYTLYWYPVLLLVAFVSFGAYISIRTATAEEGDKSEPKVYGPGGKPLPMTKKKNRDGEKRIYYGPEFGPFALAVFRYISVGLILSFCANGAAVTLHVVFNHWRAPHDGPDAWWSDEPMTVREISQKCNNLQRPLLPLFLSHEYGFVSTQT
jgi:ATP-binding cassette, subfamily B, vacuolar membrane transporter HMT1/ACLQ